MSPLRILGSALGLLLLAAVAAAGPAPANAADAPLGSAARAASGDGLPATLTLDAVTPAIPLPHGTLLVSGRLHNDGSTPIPNPYVRLRISADPLDTRSQITDIAAGSDIREGTPLQTTRRDLGAVLAPGREEAFAITVAVDDLALGAFGVYVLSVEGREPHLPTGSRVGIARTFLPWMPAQTPPAQTPLPQTPSTQTPLTQTPLTQSPLVRTNVAWLWPLADVPHRNTAGVFVDDRLAASMAPDGRLGLLVGAAATAARVPVTWVVDPMLLDDAATMANGYQLGGPGRKPVAGSAGETAAGWLARLTRGLRPERIATLPFGAPDVVALTRRRYGADVAGAMAYGRTRAAEILGLSPVTDLAWPPDGYADAATLRTLAGAGARAVVLAGSSLPPSGDLSYTPTGRAATATGIDVLLTDSRLDALVASNPVTVEAFITARQRFLAETAMITAEAPNGVGGKPRTVLLAPPLRWSPSRPWAAELLAVTATAPWLTPTDVATLRATPAPDIARASLTYPSEARRQELRSPQLAAIGADRFAIENFLSVLSQPELVRPAYQHALWRLESAAWRGEGPRALAAAADLRVAIRTERARVHVLPAAVTLAARSGRIPVTITNDLDQSVTVGLSVQPNNRRLAVGRLPRLVIGPNHKQQLLIPATALANGLVLLEVQLRTPAGTAYGSPVVVRVSVAQYGTVGTYITVGAAVVLFGAAAVRIFRRLRGARRPPAARGPA